jgi:hypothetical protein
MNVATAPSSCCCVRAPSTPKQPKRRHPPQRAAYPRHFPSLGPTPGAANAGIPLSIIVKEYGWSTYFSTLIGACGLALLLLAPMVNLRSYVQRKEQRRLRKGL